MLRTKATSISLDGNFKLEASGQEINVKASRARAILAILATTDGHKKSRDALKALLWPRSDEKQASGSMRTALSSLRQDLGADADLIGANRTHIWLNGPVDLHLPGNGEAFSKTHPPI